MKRLAGRMLFCFVFLLLAVGLLSAARETDTQAGCRYSTWTSLSFNLENRAYVFCNWYSPDLTGQVLEKGEVLIYRKNARGEVQRLLADKQAGPGSLGYHACEGIIHLYSEAGDTAGLSGESRFRYVLLPEELPLSESGEPLDPDNYEAVKAMLELPD